MKFLNQCGRSMIEMLGVLAIIGVLSVGGINGYNRAMFKYKLNKQAEQLNQVINTVAIYSKSFNNLPSTETHITPYLIKLGEIPTDMIKNTNPNYIYDIFNSKIYVVKDLSREEMALYIYFSLTTEGSNTLAVCQNIFNIIKENSNNIYAMYSMSGYHSDDQRGSNIYGDQSCAKAEKCIKNMSYQNIEQECALHFGSTKKDGHFTILWKI